MQIKQSKDKKKIAPKYCKTHKCHFFKNCPLCSPSPQQLLEEERYMKQIKNQHGVLGGDVTPKYDDGTEV